VIPADFTQPPTAAELLHQCDNLPLGAQMELMRGLIVAAARLDNAGAHWWLDGGALLGACRNAQIIPGDHDIDVVVVRDTEP